LDYKELDAIKGNYYKFSDFDDLTTMFPSIIDRVNTGNTDDHLEETRSYLSEMTSWENVAPLWQELYETH
jgi:hypothetical protein